VHAAREGAAVLAAWSIDLEGEEPERLARASRHLARSAEPPAYTPAPPRPLSRVSGLALFMLAAGRPDSAVGWLLVCRELGLLADEISRVHRSRGEHQRANEIETGLRGDLAEIRARIDADRPEAVPVEPDVETEAAKRAREPLGPATRQAPERVDVVDEADRSDPPTSSAAALKIFIGRDRSWARGFAGARRLGSLNRRTSLGSGLLHELCHLSMPKMCNLGRTGPMQTLIARGPDHIHIHIHIYRRSSCAGS
jgi:hypothetical protein